MYNLQNQIIVSSLIGISSCCTTFLCSLIHPIKTDTNWRDVALYGALGSLIASKYIMKNLKM
jgi:hypothetical protein